MKNDNQAGKGSRQRSVDQHKFDTNWDRIFGFTDDPDKSEKQNDHDYLAQLDEQLLDLGEGV